MDEDFCMAVLEKKVLRYGPPEIFNTSQGCLMKWVHFRLDVTKILIAFIASFQTLGICFHDIPMYHRA
jgi:hypothetical protein